MNEPKKTRTAHGVLFPSGSLSELAAKARDCGNCDLWTNAMHTVFGEGRASARIMSIGEQPGNDEDKAGYPFVDLRDGSWVEAGIDRKKTYVTNMVKHFKFIHRGKRWIHDKPNANEVAACPLT